VLLPLALTGFFETYDVALLTLAAPVLAQGLGLGIGAFAFSVALIRLASLASVPVLRLADRWGRRTLLFVSLGIFTLATGMTALAMGLVAFVMLQMLARVFLATESALASLVIAEEFRPHRRGAGLSVLGVVSGLGFGAVGGLLLLVPLTPLGWRLFYLVALIPLGIVAYLRRNLRETRAFVAARGEHRLQASFWPRVDRAHRRTLLKAAALVSAFGLVQTTGFFYASDLAQNTYGWSGRFTAIVITAGVFGVLGFFLGGRISDVVGRRPVVAIANVLAAVGTILIFSDQRALFIPGFFLAAAAGACFLTATLAYVAELFPTEIRATLSAFVISCQVAAGSLGLALMGAVDGVISTSLVMVILGGSLLASLLLLRGLPEARGRDLIRSGRPELEPAPEPQDGLRAVQEIAVPA
jgi:putative MFS transporter